jgi:hypothetical protein
VRAALDYAAVSAIAAAQVRDGEQPYAVREHNLEAGPAFVRAGRYRACSVCADHAIRSNSASTASKRRRASLSMAARA